MKINTASIDFFNIVQLYKINILYTCFLNAPILITYIATLNKSNKNKLKINSQVKYEITCANRSINV